MTAGCKDCPVHMVVLLFSPLGPWNQVAGDHRRNPNTRCVCLVKCAITGDYAISAITAVLKFCSAGQSIKGISK